MIDSEKQFSILAPLRLSLAGGGTDVEPFASQAGSRILNFSINLDVEAAVRVRPSQEKKVTVRIISGNQTEADSPFSQSLATSLEKRLHKPRDVQIQLTNPVGPGSGLGTSSAMILAARIAIDTVDEKSIDSHQIIDDSFLLERTEMSIDGGFQDFYPAMFGGMNWITRSPGNSPCQREAIELPPAIHDLISAKMYCIELGIPRNGGEIIKDQVSRLHNPKSSTRDSLLAQLEIASKIREAMQNDDVSGILTLLEESYINKKNYSPLISTPAIDAIEATLTKLGARGIKVSGAGGGGHMFGFFPDGIPSGITTQLPSHVRHVPCSMTRAGWRYVER